LVSYDEMKLLPVLTPDTALFLDFDGTLAELAPQPSAVRVPLGLVPTLAVLQQQLGGALAIITGRREADIDHFLEPLRLPMASEHGAQYRFSDGSGCDMAAPDLSPALQAADQLVSQHSGLLLERKTSSMALHYRHAPYLEKLCRDTLTKVMEEMNGVEILAGKYVLEVKPAGMNKGQAIAFFMSHAPFAGGTPLFAGDDVTDEAGFAAVQDMGGYGIKIGQGSSHARYRCLSPASLRGWLAFARSSLSMQATRGSTV
jgi:trehalose 6-phosphate phosphatase